MNFDGGVGKPDTLRVSPSLEQKSIRQSVSQTDRQPDRIHDLRMDRQISRQSVRQTDRQTDRRTDRRTNRQTRRQLGRLLDNQADRPQKTSVPLPFAFLSRFAVMVDRTARLQHVNERISIDLF